MLSGVAAFSLTTWLVAKSGSRSLFATSMNYSKLLIA